MGRDEADSKTRKLRGCQLLAGEAVKEDKLESISILAAGIAHDFNNYLATLLGNISLAMSYTDKDNKAYNIILIPGCSWRQRQSRIRVRRAIAWKFN